MLRNVHHRQPTMILLVSFPIRKENVWTEFTNFACNHVLQNGMFFRIENRTKVIFQGVSPTFFRFPCNFSGRVHVARDCWNVVCAMAKNHSISSMFHRTLLDSLLSPHFSTAFPTLASGSSTSLAGIPVDKSMHLCNHGYALGDALDSPLSQIWRSPGQLGQARSLHRNRHTLKMAHACQMAGRSAILTCPAL